ncbi:contractile injection system protein, VgrG/Pvc8 family [Paenibacillus thiaminolyticus]|uniref:contractile injection system protein, VgrG/Pvc8 family n=1 Tax=Paenibacillus thiaminolyticus TaxID=49283 RepID=UPI00232BD975|nr:contractile injection system protein, VgrG/Pvc8 family [Paenibacillus thiaminolyticus]WCF08122.1 contractile injection system protein, VgrG/Pvc8 family [Paenibacillus thiaminolyticus]
MANDTDTIEIPELSDEGDVIRTLFHGVLSDIAVMVVRGVYHLEIEAVSHSYRLDVKPKTRSFQNHKMPYEELVQHILSGYLGSDFIDLTFGNAPLDQFTVQYQETDWQFLQRMVSRFGTVLIPEAAADSPKLWVGSPEGKPDSLRNTNYQVLRTLNNYGQKEDGVTSYSIVTKRYYNLGDRILFKNKPLIVTGSTSLLREGMITHEYILQAEADSRWQPIWNESIRGISLAGKVIDAVKDKVKLHLNIDDVQTKEDACWFPYSSPYVAEGKTGLYCIPQIGDTVQLYIPNHREEEAFVRSSLRQGGNSPKLGNPGVKYWGNPFGKELRFSGNELRMTAQENHVFMKLHDTEGIELHSKEAIVLHADREIELEAGRLDIRDKEAVYLLSGSSSIVLDGDTDVKAGHVTVKGLTKSPVHVEQPDSPAGKGSARNGNSLQSSTELALYALAMIPGIGNAAALGSKTIAATGGNTSHLPSNKTGKSSSVADYSKAAISMMGSIPSPLPATKTITINNPKDASELITMTKAMQLSKVFTSARGLPNQLLAEDVVEKLKLSMKLWAITEQGKEKPPREPLPKYMNDAVKDVGYEKAYQIYKVIQEKGEGVNREDAKNWV